ncbi:hypothetical protein FH972_011972 [Carpinus fangiana]|uniref:Uncharacterized protein n=1 Tax=Carpinus fangiana TaxID=176857 RepID=A0A5N6R3A5_9ROSI|nr:hypothetical protein FH972_011972 [Carpinus fangiana]
MMHGFPMLEMMQKLMDDEEKERKKLEKEPLELEEPQCEEDAIPVEVATEVHDAIPAAKLRRRHPGRGQLIVAEQVTEEVAAKVQDAIPEAGPKVKHE